MKVVFHLETASFVYLFETSHPEPRRIHLLRLLLLIPAEAVTERYGKAAGVVLYSKCWVPLRDSMSRWFIPLKRSVPFSWSIALSPAKV